MSQVGFESSQKRNTKIVKETIAAGGVSHSPYISAAGVHAFNAMPLHQCYWNDRLVIAVMCRLPWKLQQRAAWCAANNGLIGYWEWQTHFGFSTAAVLEKLEIPLDLGFSTRPSPANSMYYLLDRSIVVALAKHFDLPTQKFRDDFEPDENTNDRLKELWTDYFPANGAYQLERPK